MREVEDDINISQAKITNTAYTLKFFERERSQKDASQITQIYLPLFVFTLYFYFKLSFKNKIDL